MGDKRGILAYPGKSRDEDMLWWVMGGVIAIPGIAIPSRSKDKGRLCWVTRWALTITGGLQGGGKQPWVGHESSAPTSRWGIGGGRGASAECKKDVCTQGHGFVKCVRYANLVGAWHSGLPPTWRHLEGSWHSGLPHTWRLKHFCIWSWRMQWMSVRCRCAGPCV